ncbi:MAG: low specificity L-threonine aldolase, partial [Erysipelotrichaceae bacterium]|nr:low specificity L-threonine aldolase [Erysipelotrichaceae bacterium]
ALLAKGRLLGVQFDAAFTDDLYFKISENAIERADELRKALKEKGYRFFVETPTNQIFVIMENKKLEQLKKQVVYSFWERYDEEHTVIRFATYWATTREEVEGLIELL